MKKILVAILFFAPALFCPALEKEASPPVDYTESTAMIKNPFMGYPTNTAILVRPAGTQIFNPSGFTWFYINLKEFSGGNVAGAPTGEKDIPLNSDALGALAKTLENLRVNGGSCLIRFVYDWDGNRGCEPKSFETLLLHLKQLCELVRPFHDVVLGFECGLVGVFGEMHSSNYSDKKYVNRIIDTYLKHSAEDQVLLLHTPSHIADYLGIPREQLAKIKTRKGQNAYRLGIFNDGYMNSESDLGTWKNRSEEIRFLFHQNKHLPYGGEYGSAFDAKFLPNPACVPENAIPEMYRTHISFIRGNVYKIGDQKNTIFGYDQFPFSKKYEKPWFPDNSAFYGSDCHTFITAHLGYRIVLRANEIAITSSKERKLLLAGTLENTGFANILHSPTAEILLKKGDTVLPYAIDFDIRALKSCKTLNYKFSIPLSAEIPAGKYEVFLRLSHCHASESAKAKSGIRFANNGAIFSEELGANKLGEINIVPAKNSR